MGRTNLVTVKRSAWVWSCPHIGKYLAKFIFLWTNFHGSKWPKTKQIIQLSGHTGYGALSQLDQLWQSISFHFSKYLNVNEIVIGNDLLVYSRHFVKIKEYTNDSQNGNAKKLSKYLIWSQCEQIGRLLKVLGDKCW